MSDKEELKRKALKEIDRLDDQTAEELNNDRGRLRDWIKGVLKEAWDVIKSAIGGLLAGIFF